MNRIETYLQLQRQINQYKRTIKESHSDAEIERSRELLELTEEDLSRLKRLLTEEERDELELHELMESHPLEEGY